ncbi:hypothetical protein FACS1894172_16430 [Spirochaetia bacterium]|nr:hypothetical protein FACS1894164_09520 [Spirochaetia bacterium]GHU35123.1 hypothetical protein FACS1894172_16430 [Spirochaetia bacterium]
MGMDLIMNNHTKKMIAPIVVVICLAVYYTAIGIILLNIALPTIVKIAFIGVSILVTIVIILVMIERIKEIKKGEEDDLSKY